MLKTAESPIYPLVYGNEEETGLMVNTGGNMDEPYLLASNLGRFTPTEVLGNKSRHTMFLQNGSKLYVGGAIGAEHPTNIERATPECSTPEELSLYVRANELLLTKLVSSFVVEHSKGMDEVAEARIQRRVVDSQGTRKGCHDNYAISEDSKLANSRVLPQEMFTHLATRSFITGAGYVRGGGLNYAQKIGGLKSVSQYGFIGSIYRISTTEGTPRLEVRCNDINISEWATAVRVGGTAIALAISETPLAKSLIGTHTSYAIRESKRCNRLLLQRDGTINTSEDQLFAVDVQQGLAEIALAKLHLYSEEMPVELFRIAQEIYEYCDDYKKVLSGDATVALLADRSDWAAKMSLILHGIEKDKQFGIKRSIKDLASRATDFRYDYIGVSAEGGKLRPLRHGTGYKLRDAGHFRFSTPGDIDVARAFRKPPENTRAALRGRLLKKYKVEGCDWSYLYVVDGELKYKMNFDDVLQTELSEDDYARLANVKLK